MSPSTPEQKKSRRQYTKEYKIEAVALAKQRGFREAAQHLGINSTMIHDWARKLEQEGKDAFRGHGVRAETEAELERLRRENARLRMERDILKK